MNRILLLVLCLLAAVGLALPGCFSRSTSPETTGLVYTSDLAEPGNLLQNLIIAYNEREIAPYESLFAPDFTFHFAPGPEADEYPGGMTREEDLRCTRNMFASERVTDIHLDMEWGDPVEVLWKNEPAVRISLLDMELRVTTLTGILQTTGHRQDFYFRMGESGRGEEPGRYYIVGWVDHGAARAVPEAEGSE